jgi:protein-tyrosine phosphatase
VRLPFFRRKPQPDGTSSHPPLPPLVDIHCHLLPGIDDGSPAWDTTLAMARMAVGDGIRHIVCTPHANEEFAYDRAAHTGLLAEAQARIGPDLRLTLGCDFHLSFKNFEDVLRRPDRYCIGETRYLLVEFSDFGIAPNTAELLEELIDSGITPIITHPERNAILQQNLPMVLEWACLGVLVQVTASALLGRWGRRASFAAHQLFENASVHVLASDAHGVSGRPPILSDAYLAVTERYGEELARLLLSDNPAAIVSGQPLPMATPAPEQK